MPLQTSIPQNIETIGGNGLAVFLQANGSLYLKDTRGNVSPLSDYISGGGGGTTIYNGDSSLTGNRVVSLGGFNISFLDNTAPLSFEISPDTDNPFISATVDSGSIGIVKDATFIRYENAVTGDTAGFNSSIDGNGEDLTSQIESRDGTNEGEAAIFVNVNRNPDNDIENNIILQAFNAPDGRIASIQVVSSETNDSAFVTLSATDYVLVETPSFSVLGTIFAQSTLATSATVITGIYNLAERPIPSGTTFGQRAFVTDAQNSQFGEFYSGEEGGANAVPVYFDGTFWRIG